MRIFRTALAVLALALVGAALVTPARADDYNKKTFITFNNAIEVPGFPGQVLPAGKYLFKLPSPATNRDIVQIWNADGTKLLITALTVSNRRLLPTHETVVEFHERKGDAPHAIRAWFYPGETLGREFVYPKPRAVELAKEFNVIVPAETVEPTVSELATVPLVAVTPQAKEESIEEAFGPVEVAENRAPAEELPRTASWTPFFVLLGTMFIGLAFGVQRLAKQLS